MSRKPRIVYMYHCLDGGVVGATLKRFPFLQAHFDLFFMTLKKNGLGHQKALEALNIPIFALEDSDVEQSLEQRAQMVLREVNPDIAIGLNFSHPTFFTFSQAAKKVGVPQVCLEIQNQMMLVENQETLQFMGDTFDYFFLAQSIRETTCMQFLM